MAKIIIRLEKNEVLPNQAFRGIGKVEDVAYWENMILLTIAGIHESRFNNVVKVVLEKNLKEQGVTPISITYAD